MFDFISRFFFALSRNMFWMTLPHHEASMKDFVLKTTLLCRCIILLCDYGCHLSWFSRDRGDRDLFEGHLLGKYLKSCKENKTPGVLSIVLRYTAQGSIYFHVVLPSAGIMSNYSFHDKPQGFFIPQRWQPYLHLWSRSEEINDLRMRVNTAIIEMHWSVIIIFISLLRCIIPQDYTNLNKLLWKLMF